MNKNRLDELRVSGFVQAQNECKDKGVIRRREEGVFRRAQTGDVDAFEELYKTKCRAIYNLCVLATGSAAAAEDLTYELFLDTFRKIQSFGNYLEISSYLRRAAFRLIVRKHRIKQQEMNTPEVQFSMTCSTKSAQS
jgi:DNA-directed RNA polymerase specialized sigma24 family protein